MRSHEERVAETKRRIAKIEQEKRWRRNTVTMASASLPYRISGQSALRQIKFRLIQKPPERLFPSALKVLPLFLLHFL